MTSLKEWIDTKIKDQDITFFEYSELSNFTQIGRGAFGVVRRADLTNRGIQIALKSFVDDVHRLISKDDVNDLVKELKLLRLVHFHPNINHFVGITIDPYGCYHMLLEYANGGTLRNYLANKKRFDSLLWTNKIQMALDMACGLMCLHKDDIIHRDLHSNNILVHNGRLMIADLGLSKKMTADASLRSTKQIEHGMPAYLEPQCYQNERYVKDKKSDIYSLGVLLWEITSGDPPFAGLMPCVVMYQICHNDHREEPVMNTPLKYQLLYQRCWDKDPIVRPDINKVYEELKQLDLQFGSVEEDDQDRVIIQEREANKALGDLLKSYLNHNKIGSTKSFDFYRDLDQYKPNAKEIFNCLLNTPTIQHYDVMVGIFHLYYFEEDHHERFYQCVMNASKQGDVCGHYELGYCYQNGYGVPVDVDKAMEYYERVADKLNIASFSLANCYNERGDTQKAFEFYKKSAVGGHVPSQQIVGEWYYSGRGTQKDLELSLEWYESYQKSGGHNDVSVKMKDLNDYLRKMKLAIGVFDFLADKYIRL